MFEVKYKAEYPTLMSDKINRKLTDAKDVMTRHVL